MARVLAVTRHAVYAIELRRQGFDVVDISGGQVDEQHVSCVDAAVLDVAELGEARRVIDLVRARAACVPIVVLGPDDPDWLALEQADEGRTALVVPPVPATAVAAAIRTLVRTTAPEPLDSGERGAPEAMEPVTVPVPAAQEDAVAPPEGTATPAPAQEVAGSLGGGGSGRTRPTLRLPRTSRRHASAGSPAPGQPGGAPDWRRAAQVLLASATDLPSVAAVADEVGAEVARVVAVDAVAVLVRDGDHLAVAGGSGLRALEARLGLACGDWVVRQLWDVAPVLVVEDTDMVRAELALAPLASRRRLLAARCAPLDAVVITGRAGERFHRDEVRAVTDVIGRETLRLADALRARDLARALAALA
ncbi:MAG: hypothetical protein ACTHQ3_07305 [Motilibacteraceae bacterium]